MAETVTAVRCEHDSGSATGCRPLCLEPATHTVRQSTACYGVLELARCERHARSAVARAYPDPCEVLELAAAVGGAR